MPFLLFGFQIKQNRNGCLASFIHVVTRCSQSFANMVFPAPSDSGWGGKWNWVGNLSPKLPLLWRQAGVSKMPINFPAVPKMAFSGLDISLDICFCKPVPVFWSSDKVSPDTVPSFSVFLWRTRCQRFQAHHKAF